ncbi:MAG: tetratricopeptide repeat protein [Treponema sp.]|jgi:tetratricopeptide (TPR) repeat protein|nr:tetratricopeptide repeat protein [Treponema sp.]
MKNLLFILPSASIVFVVAASCAYRVDNETLLLYAKAKNIYDNGDMSGTAAALARDGWAARLGAFPPALMLRGKASYFTDNLDEAEKVFRKALKIRPSAVEASLYLARIMRETGRGGEARNIVEGLLSDDPSNIRVLRLAAATALDNGKAGEAEAVNYLDRAIEASVETALVFIERARIRWISGNAASALDDLERAKTLVCDNEPLSRSIHQLERAIKEVIQ